MLDYKIVQEIEDGQGNVIFQKVRYYEGAVTTEQEYDEDSRDLAPADRTTTGITRYRRTSMVQETDYDYE